MANPTKVLLQTTIPFTEDDWHIGRFSLLHDYLAAYCPDFEGSCRDLREETQRWSRCWWGLIHLAENGLGYCRQRFAQRR